MQEPARGHHATVRVRLPDDREVHTVTVSTDTTILSITCSCIAGSAGRSCEHKLGVLLHDRSILADQTHVADLNTIQAWIRQTPFLTVWDAYQASRTQLRTLETQLDRYLRQGLPRIL